MELEPGHLALYSLIITAIISPVAVGGLQYFVRRAEIRHQEKREDVIANRVNQVAVDARISALTANTKLDTIHGLVNSQLSSALQSEHDALVGQLALMRELVAIRRGEGTGPSTETIATMDIISRRIAELVAVLADREARQ